MAFVKGLGEGISKIPILECGCIINVLNKGDSRKSLVREDNNIFLEQLTLRSMWVP